MGLHFEFDRANRILLLKVEGCLTEEVMTDAQLAIRNHSTATDSRVGIFDFSGVTAFDVSTPFIRTLATQGLSISASRRGIIVVPSTHGFGLARMFQLLGDQARPRLQVVRTMDEALSILRISSPQFEPLD
jgi:hypothetical protein